MLTNIACTFDDSIKLLAASVGVDPDYIDILTVDPESEIRYIINSNDCTIDEINPDGSAEHVVEFEDEESFRLLEMIMDTYIKLYEFGNYEAYYCTDGINERFRSSHIDNDGYESESDDEE